MRIIPKHLALCSLLLAGAGTFRSVCLAQGFPPDLLEDELNLAAVRGNLANSFQALSIVGATPGVTAANFYVDHEEPAGQSTIHSVKVPIPIEFGKMGQGIHVYTELTLGHLTSQDQGDVVLVPNEPTHLRADTSVWTVLGGIGLSIPIARSTVIRPMAMVGYSWIDTEGDADGPFADEISEAAKDLLFASEIDSFLSGVALELRHEGMLDSRHGLKATARFSHILDDVQTSSSPLLDISSNFDVLTASAEISGPTGNAVNGREIKWIAVIEGTHLPGTSVDLLGFTHFVRLGGGFRLDISGIVPEVSSIELRSSAIIGNNVTGWTFGLVVDLF